MRKRLGCTKRGGRYIVPSRSTLYRFINAVDPWEVDKLLGLWLSTFGGEDQGIAIDHAGDREGPDPPAPCFTRRHP